MREKLFAVLWVALMAVAAAPFYMADAEILQDDPAEISGEISDSGGDVTYLVECEYDTGIVSDSGRMLFRDVNMNDYVTCKIFGADGEAVLVTESIPAFGTPFATAVDLVPGTYTVMLIGDNNRAERQWSLEIEERFDIHYTDEDDLAVIKVSSEEVIPLPGLTHISAVASGIMTLTLFGYWSMTSSGDACDDADAEWNTRLYAVWDEETEYRVTYSSSFVL